MKFLLDSSFLLYVLEWKIDFLDELTKFGRPELYVTKSVFLELKNISHEKGKKGKNARVALTFIDKKAEIVNDYAYTGSTDEKIAKVAENGNFVVCTQDFGLKKRLKQLNLPVVVIRQKKYLEKE